MDILSLQNNGHTINHPDSEGNTLLHLAVKNIDVGAIEELLPRNAKLDIKNNRDKTPLQLMIDRVFEKIEARAKAFNYQSQRWISVGIDVPLKSLDPEWVTICDLMANHGAVLTAEQSNWFMLMGIDVVQAQQKFASRTQDETIKNTQVIENVIDEQKSQSALIGDLTESVTESFRRVSGITNRQKLVIEEVSSRMSADINRLQGVITDMEIERTQQKSQIAQQGTQIEFLFSAVKAMLATQSPQLTNPGSSSAHGRARLTFFAADNDLDEVARLRQEVATLTQRVEELEDKMKTLSDQNQTANQLNT